MGCDLSNTINEGAYQSGHPVVVHPHDGSSYYNQNANQFQENPQYQAGFIPSSYPQNQPLVQQGYAKQLENVSSMPYQTNFQGQSIPQTLVSNQIPQHIQNQNKENLQGTKPQIQNIQQKPHQQPKPRPENRRGIMPLRINQDDSFLTHHLKGEMHMCKYARADFIKKRQILQHQRYEQVLGRGCSTKHNHLNEFAIKSHYQRVMLQIFEKADKQFFQEGKSYDDVRQKVAESYLFELFQNKEFLDASFGRYQSIFAITQFNMSMTALASDSALFPILRFLKQKYPQVADKSTIKFPDVKQIKNDVNLLDNFPSKCYSSQGLINVQTLFSDLKFLIDRSVEEFADFQSDMKFILGDDVLTDSKVKKVTKNGMQEYSASPVRRVFIKWAQTILERIPEIIFSEAFLQFVRSKTLISDNFYFKSTVQPTTHGMVIKFICNLLQAAKYDITTLAKRKDFGFYIYDLLRCKTKRKTGEQVCGLLKKMQQTKVTPSGKKFQVVRIKNRFKTANRDLMVNFRYGDVIVGQAQLCIDTSDVSQKIKKTNKFNHYIYELERGLFGPTCELIMQYEDFQRKDISANLQAEGPVQKRSSKQPISYLKKTTSKCFNNHDMIELEGNQFVKSDNGTYEEQQFYCDFCEASFPSSQKYYYCYFCTLVFCKGCESEYKKLPIKEIQNRCNRQDLIIDLKNQQDLTKVLNQNPIVIFYLSKGQASTVYKDFLAYYCTINKLQKKQLPPIYAICCDDATNQNILNKYQIKEFPTTIVFSQDGTPQSTLIGASYEMIEGLIEVQKKLLRGQPKALQMKCFCGCPFEQTELEEDSQMNCLSCGNASLNDNFFGGLLGDSRSFACANGHLRCQNCAFLAVNQPSKYRDYRGKSYLTDKKQKPQLPKCLSGHQTVFTKQIDICQTLQCFKCLKPFLFNNVLGAANCLTCKKYCCPQCIGISDEQSKQSQVQLVTHTIEATVQEGDKCICGRLFKKVYSTRDYTNNIAANPVEGEDNQLLIMASVFQNQVRTWKCALCAKEKNDGQLHLACFRCPVLAEMQSNENVEICIECAIISDMLNKQLQPKINEEQTTLVCKSSHAVVRTKLAYNNGQMTFDCIGCRKNFYIYSERYYCKTCRTNVCLKCQSSQLTNKKPPSCVRKCDQKHQLKLKENSQTLSFCNACRVVIRKTHFECLEGCSFDLCLECAATSPHVDTKRKRLQKIDYASVKKELQSYERGWADTIMDGAAEVVQHIDAIQQNLEGMENALQQAANFFDF